MLHHVCNVADASTVHIGVHWWSYIFVYQALNGVPVLNPEITCACISWPQVLFVLVMLTLFSLLHSRATTAHNLDRDCDPACSSSSKEFQSRHQTPYIMLSSRHLSLSRHRVFSCSSMHGVSYIELPPPRRSTPSVLSSPTEICNPGSGWSLQHCVHQRQDWPDHWPDHCSLRACLSLLATSWPRPSSALLQ